MKKNCTNIKYIAVLLCVFISVSFSGCSKISDMLFPQVSYEAENNPNSSNLIQKEKKNEVNPIIGILEAGHSDYGRLSLDEAEQKAYVAIKNTFFDYNESVVIEETTTEQLDRILLYMENDYPLLNWVDSKYTYQKTLNHKMRLSFSYKVPREELIVELNEIVDAANSKIRDIPNGLADFDKAILAHDYLLSDLVYDKGAVNKSEAKGAFLAKRAACVGYAKAYQYLLCKMGIDTLMIYGNANEAHAWNAVKLGDSYYFADPTWNDVDNEDKTSYVSHEYTFLSKKQLLKTHNFESEKWNYPIPECTKEDMNFAVQKDFVVKSDSMDEIKAKLDLALSYALANNSCAIQIAFLNEELFYKAIDSLESGELDGAVYKMCEERTDKKAIARSSNNKLFYLTYIMGNNDGESTDIEVE